MDRKQLLESLGLTAKNPGTYATSWLDIQGCNWLTSVSPVDGEEIAQVALSTPSQYEEAISGARDNFQTWKMLPAPKRGEIVREIADAFRKNKEPLAKLISLEMGKILAEAEGEVQEVIDIADFCVGLSRQLYGKTMHSERSQHRMYEQWHPLGLVGVISAFNFPAAVWSWNAMVAAICGNSVVWKPSEQTPLTALACTNLANEVSARHGFPGLFTLITGDGPELGKTLAADSRFPLISATGSCRMGKSVAETVGKRLGRSLLELGGNNAVIILADADLKLAERAVLFGAVGTAGQRCTSTRRVYLEKSIAKDFRERLVKNYQQIRIGNPLDPETLIGPLVNRQAVEAYQVAISEIPKQGGEILCGGAVLGDMPSNLYVEPTIVSVQATDIPLMKEETFAPILYIVEIDSLEDGIERNNAVAQGLSSAIFTSKLQSAESFLSHQGSDCGIANVNIGTSGAEIGGAFGGEKETGGGREAGSDSWKAYMRRQTNTINWGQELPLAQGISFG